MRAVAMAGRRNEGRFGARRGSLGWVAGTNAALRA